LYDAEDLKHHVGDYDHDDHYNQILDEDRGGEVASTTARGAELTFLHLPAGVLVTLFVIVSSPAHEASSKQLSVPGLYKRASRKTGGSTGTSVLQRTPSKRPNESVARSRSSPTA
jgi:hypothetical protein